MKTQFDQPQLQELLYQALETERGGVKIYETALLCALNKDLHEEWDKYLTQTRHHVEVLNKLFGKLGLDVNKMTPGRQVVGHLGKSLVGAMEMALAAGEPAAAELVACECVVLAETKDHSNWELIGHVVKEGQDESGGDQIEALKTAFDEVEQDEDHHLYHTMGWCRELWIQSLGFEAVLPPPEEVKKVATAIGAARAEQERDEMLEEDHSTTQNKKKK